MRYVVLFIGVLLLGCGTTRSSWLLEVNRLAAQPLSCEQFDVVTMHHRAHEYDSLGCGQAIRYVCQSGACSPSGDVVPDSNPGIARLVDRVSHTRSVLSQAASGITRECAGGATFAARMFVDPQGTLTEVQTNPDRGDCVHRNLPRLPAGTGSMVIAFVFVGS